MITSIRAIFINADILHELHELSGILLMAFNSILALYCRRYSSRPVDLSWFIWRLGRDGGRSSVQIDYHRWSGARCVSKNTLVVAPLRTQQIKTRLSFFLSYIVFLFAFYRYNKYKDNNFRSGLFLFIEIKVNQIKVIPIGRVSIILILSFSSICFY